MHLRPPLYCMSYCLASGSSPVASVVILDSMSMMFHDVIAYKGSAGAPTWPHQSESPAYLIEAASVKVRELLEANKPVRDGDFTTPEVRLPDFHSSTW